jgi:uncharacterized protein (TIGR00369 family)
MPKKSVQTRHRMVTWVSPTIDPEAISTTGGLALLRSVKDGRTPPPPVWSLIDLRLVDVDDGRAIFEIQFSEFHYNRFAKVQGGIECTVLDAAMGYAVYSTMPAGVTCTTLELKVNYVRPISNETGLMRCISSVIHKGNQVVVAEAKLMDREQLLYAHAVSTFLALNAARGVGES